MQVLVILSGGIDSTTALASAQAQGHEIKGAVHFNYGAKQNAQEDLAVQKITAHYQLPHFRLPLGFINDFFKSDLLLSGGAIPEGHYTDTSMQKTVVPFRNGIMLAIATGLAESIKAEAIILGNHQGDHLTYPDCRPEFIKAMQAAMRAGTYAGIQLLSPFCTQSKTDIVKLGRELNVPYHLTYSCYQGEIKHCGRCGTCVARREAFLKAGQIDPTEYAE